MPILRLLAGISRTICTGPLLLFSCLAVLFFGCADSSQSGLGRFEVTNTNSPQTQAFMIIEDALSDIDPLARVNGIEVVGTTRLARFLPRVQVLLEDQIVPVRFAAALAIGDMQYTPAKAALNPLLKDRNSNVIIAASYAMARLGYPEYLQVVRGALESKDQTIRANAAFLLGRAGDRSSLRLLQQIQEDKNSTDKVRFQALEARANLGDEEVLAKLWAIVYSGYHDDRIMGIKAMGALRSRKAQEILLTKLDDSVLEVRLAAAEQLGNLGDTTGETEVLAVFEQNLATGPDKQTNERINVLTALAIGRICTPKLTKYLPQLLRNESKFARIAAAKAVFQCRIR
ncbi:MAG: HEAT repeat domain-containing protein [Planctomycetota bacterium]